MVQDLLSIIPRGLAGCSPAWAVGGALAGAVLWLTGATFSRSLVTLLLVAVGTWTGLHLPGWCRWSIDGMGPAIGGAVLLGCSGYLLHRMWIGAGLGGALALWAGITCWIVQGAPMWVAPIDMPVGPTSAGLLARGVAGFAHLVPPALGQTLPAACAAGLIGGMLIAIVYPELTRVLACSMIGMTIFVAMGAIAVQELRPQWLMAIPGGIGAGGLTLAVLAAAGAAAQWRMISPVDGEGRPAAPAG